MKFFPRLDGTTVNKFLLGLAQGVLLKSGNGNLTIRNQLDTADADLTVNKVNVSGQTLELNSDATDVGDDQRYRLIAPSNGMAAKVELVLPASVGSPGQVIATDGSGNLSFVSVASDVSLTVDTTTIDFSSTSTVQAFTLPANAVVESVAVIIDTSFDSQAQLSVGVNGEASRYMNAGDSALGFEGGSVFEVKPGTYANASPEVIEIAYSAAGATEGSCRVEVRYSVPA
jgi:hypothetical protein